MLGAEALRMALRSLWSHKLRSTMVILGVVIGVSSVLAVTSLGAAFEASITSNFDDLDDRSIFVTATAAGPQQGPPDAGQFGLIFTEVDRQHIAGLPGADRVIAQGSVAVSGIASGGNDLPFRTLTATQADADEVRDLGLYHTGGPFSDGDGAIVLGWSVATQLGRGAPVQAGADLAITFVDGSKQTVTVVGVLAEQESLFGSGNTAAYVPIDPFYDVRRESPSTGATVRVYDGFTVFAATSGDVAPLQDAVRAYMEADADAAQLLAEDLQILVTTPSDISGSISAAFDQITIFIAAIAGVSLLVGGIMIGTIMLITVSERTKEIGMMKAIGARDRDVLWMFLLEAALVGTLGTMVGIAAGLGGGAALVGGLFGGEDVSFVVPWDWLGISILVGIGTGVVAGWLPARRATKIEPVEALSYE